MRLKLLAISDTHLGKETSLLSFPCGLRWLWKILAQDQGFWKPIFPDFDPEKEEKVEVDELILMGDIPDRTLSSTSRISSSTQAFNMMLESALDIKKSIYIPGNHDHTLWTNYKDLRNGSAGSSGITDAPEGDLIVERGERRDENRCAEEILSIFFGHPLGWAWTKIKDERKPDFAIANPVYAKQIDGRTYVFAHGTHFRIEVASKLEKRLIQIADFLQLDRLANLQLEPIHDLSKATSLEELEQYVGPFVDSLWPSSRNNPTSRCDELRYLCTRLRDGAGKRRAAPEGSEIFFGEGLRQASEDRINKLTVNDKPLDKSVEHWRTYFLPHMLAYLEFKGFSQDNVTFVYGDTHRGGWGELPSGSGGRVRIYNCGGWVVDNKEHHPACHLFAVGEDGEEHLFDISFRGAEVDGESLLELVAQDDGDHLENARFVVRTLLKLLLPIYSGVHKDWPRPLRGGALKRKRQFNEPAGE
jgi:hypothetical protein